MSVALLRVHPRQPLPQSLGVSHALPCVLPRHSGGPRLGVSRTSLCACSTAPAPSLGASHALGLNKTSALVSVTLLRVHPRQPLPQVLVLVTHCRVCFLDTAEAHALVSVALPRQPLPQVLVVVTHCRVCSLDTAEARALGSVALLHPRQPLPRSLGVSHALACVLPRHSGGPRLGVSRTSLCASSTAPAPSLGVSHALPGVLPRHSGGPPLLSAAHSSLVLPSIRT